MPKRTPNLCRIGTGVDTDLPDERERSLRQKMRLRWTVCMRKIMGSRSEMQFCRLTGKEYTITGLCGIAGLQLPCSRITVIPCLMPMLFGVAIVTDDTVCTSFDRGLNCNMIMPGSMTIEPDRVRKRRRIVSDDLA